MKNGKFKNLIFGFLSKVTIKKFLLVVYCVVPILVFSVGFAAWKITGSDTSGIASGSFLTYNVINSYDYVPEIDFSSNGNGLYPTRFYDDDKVVSAANIDVTATIDLGNCSKLADTLYAEFTLSFLNGSDYADFFRGLSVRSVSATQTTKNTDGKEKPDFSGDSVFSLSDDGLYKGSGYTFTHKDSEGTTQKTATISTNEVTKKSDGSLYIGGTSSNSSYKIKFTISTKNASPAEGGNAEGATEGVQTTGSNTLYLKITYTLDPEAADYITLYQKLVDNNLKFLIDVKIYN